MTFETIQAVLAKHLEVEEGAITMETSITKDLGADSLDMLDILMDLEEAYEFNIPEKQIGFVVGDMVRYIDSRDSGKAVARQGELVEAKMPA